MKKRTGMICVLALMCTMLYGAGTAHSGVLGDRWTLTINGIDIDRLNQTIKEDPLQAIAGAVVAIIVHEASHVIAMEVVGVEDYRFDLPLTFTYRTTGLSNSDMRWISRSGFLGQALVGTFLTQIPLTRELPFTFGYTAGAALQTLAYPLPPGNGDENDLGQLDKRGGHIWVEWGAYSALSLFNLYNSVKKVDRDTPWSDPEISMNDDHLLTKDMEGLFKKVLDK